MAKPIVITDDSVLNSFGFRVLSEGGDMSQFEKNPVMLYDHVRRYGDNDKDIILPIGKWQDLKRLGSQWVATPVFDTDDEFANKIASKYEKDILNMASIGFEAIEWSNDPALMLPGQTGPTVTKWILKEASITDIGSNPNACKLSHAGKVIVLNEKTQPDELTNFFNSNKSIPTMKKVIAALNGSKLVTLNEAAGEELVAAGVETLVQQLSAKDSVISAKDAEIARLQKEAGDAKTAALKDKATQLVESALSAKKIVAAQKDKFVKLASANEEGYTMVKEMLDSMKGFEGVVHMLKDGKELPASKTELVKLADTLLKEGGWEAYNDEQIKAIWKAKHGKEINENTLTALKGK
jgi:hypothetical protein